MEDIKIYVQTSVASPINLVKKLKAYKESHHTGVSGGIYYEGIYMVKVILAEIYMLEHFL